MRKFKLVLLVLATGFLLQSCSVARSGCGGNPIHLGN